VEPPFASYCDTIFVRSYLVHFLRVPSKNRRNPLKPLQSFSYLSFSFELYNPLGLIASYKV
jgi:hypothetical protein